MLVGVPKLWTETIDAHRAAVRDAALDAMAAHLDQLTAATDPAAPAIRRLEAILQTYAHLQQQSRHHGGELAMLLHRGAHVDQARQRLRDFVRQVIAEAARDGDVRTDVAAEELADYCLQALTAAGAVARLVTVTLAGLRP
jgi:hypothetical protein